MRSTPIRTLLTAAFSGAVVLTSVVGAQGTGAPPTGQPPAGAPRSRTGQPPRPGQAPQRIEVEVERRRGMGRAARGNPAAMLLAMRGPLGLSAEQVTRLEALRDAPRPDNQASDLLRARADFMDAMKGDGNLTAARAAMDRMAKLRTDRAMAGLKARQEARAVLTPAQKTQLDNLRRQAVGRLRMTRRGGGAMRAPGAAEQLIEERFIQDGQEQVIRRRIRPPEPPVAPQAPLVPHAPVRPESGTK